MFVQLLYKNTVTVALRAVFGCFSGNIRVIAIATEGERFVFRGLREKICAFIVGVNYAKRLKARRINRRIRIKSAKKIRLVVPVFIPCSVEFKMLVSNICKNRRAKIYVSKAVCFRRKTVGACFHNRVLTAVIRHFPKKPLYNRRFRRGLVLAVPNCLPAETALYCGKEPRFFFHHHKQLPDKINGCAFPLCPGNACYIHPP